MFPRTRSHVLLSLAILSLSLICASSQLYGPHVATIGSACSRNQDCNAKLLFCKNGYCICEYGSLMTRESDRLQCSLIRCIRDTDCAAFPNSICRIYTRFSDNRCDCGIGFRLDDSEQICVAVSGEKSRLDIIICVLLFGFPVLTCVMLLSLFIKQAKARRPNSESVLAPSFSFISDAFGHANSAGTDTASPTIITNTDDPPPPYVPPPPYPGIRSSANRKQTAAPRTASVV